jgi:hypothetical protein
MAVLPGVLGCRPLRRTAQLRLGANTLWLPGGPPIFVVSRQGFIKYPGWSNLLCNIFPCALHLVPCASMLLDYCILASGCFLLTAYCLQSSVQEDLPISINGFHHPASTTGYRSERICFHMHRKFQNVSQQGVQSPEQCSASRQPDTIVRDV